MVKTVQRRTVSKPAAGEWDCTKCGTRNRGDGAKCSACEQETRPAKLSRGGVGKLATKPTPKPVKPVKAWKCPECRGESLEQEPQCSVCGAFSNPRLTTLQRQLATIVSPNEDAASAWYAMSFAGATDSEILDLAEQCLDHAGKPHGGCAVGDRWICWRLGDCVIEIWPDRSEPGDDLQAIDEGELLDELRAAFLIEERTAGTQPVTQTPPAKPAARTVADVAADVPTVGEVDVPPAEIAVSELNPRVHFDEAKLEELAASLKAHGQLQNLVVYRRGDGRLELIAGERRLRASKLAKLPTVRCRVLDVTEAQAVELRGIENLVREDLSAIETARWYQQMLDRCNYTQQALADRLGCSQPTIANRLRLLKLPEAWQQRVISREIPEAHARELVPWCDLPAVMESMREVADDEDGLPSVSDWQRKLRDVLEEVSLPVKPRAWFSATSVLFSQEGRGYRYGNVAFTAKDVAKAGEELDVRDVPTYRGETEQRAFNIAAWERLQAAAEARAKNRTEPKDDDDQPSAARKETAADREAKAAAQAKQLAGRLYGYRIDWLQARCVETLRETDDQEILIRSALHFAALGEYSQRNDVLSGTLAAAGVKRVNWATSPWQSLANAEGPTLTRLLRDVVAAWWSHPTEGYAFHDVRPADLEALAVELDVDLKRDWRVDERFLLIFTKEQLWNLVAEWKIEQHKAWLAAGPKDKRGDLIAALLKVDESLTGAKKRLPAPKCLLNAKGR